MAFSKFVQAQKTGGTPPAAGAKAPPFPPKKPAAAPPAAGAKASPFPPKKPAAAPPAKKDAGTTDPTKCPDCGKTIPEGEDDCPNCAGDDDDGDETDTTKAPNPLMMWAKKNSSKAGANAQPTPGKPPQAG